jgi:hypothetical protein
VFRKVNKYVFLKIITADSIMFKKVYLSFTIIIIATVSTFSQPKKLAWQEEGSKKNSLIQFSGVVVEGDSLNPVPYTSIIVKHARRGTISDYFGYYSFVAATGDTIEFSAIGFSSANYIIPDTLGSNMYSLIQVLRRDTIYLKTAEVFPWPSREQFKQAFLNLNIKDDDLARATRNMNRSDMRDQMLGMAMDASLNYKYSMQQNQSRLYYAGQYPSINLLNPIAWAKFIQAWKNGDFKKKN